MVENFRDSQEEKQFRQFQEYQQQQEEEKKRKRKKGWLWGCSGCLVLLILLIIGLTSCTGAFINEADKEINKDSSEVKEDKNSSKEQTAALNSAKNYADGMNMSKQGIYDQLTSSAGDKFSKKDAQYAIDHLKADYKKNALKSAESYHCLLYTSDAADE